MTYFRKRVLMEEKDRVKHREEGEFQRQAILSKRKQNYETYK